MIRQLLNVLRVVFTPSVPHHRHRDPRNHRVAADTRPRLEWAICACGDRFLRGAAPHPSTCCTACDERAMERWMANEEARQAVRGSEIRRVS